MGMAIKPSSAAEPFGAYRADYVIPGAVGILVAVFVGGALFHAGSAWLRWLAEGHKQDTRRVLHTGRAEQHAGMISVAATPADQGALSAPKNDIV